MFKNLTAVFVLFFSLNSYSDFQLCGMEDSPDRLIAMLDDEKNFDFWDEDRAQDLSFCIDKRFKTRAPKLEKALRYAANEWMKYANVDFQLTQDLSCDSKKAFFKVIPVNRRSRFAARAFFPSYPEKKRVLKVKAFYLRHHESEINRLMIHELGHILGFRHEHIHAEQGGTCLEANQNFESMTDYDPLSVMDSKF